jgi:hypothetical protein
MYRLFCLYLLFISIPLHAQYSRIIAGHGGSGGYLGDGGPATAAFLRDPYDVAISRSGNIYIAEYTNHVIRKINPAGIITTVAGNHTMGYTGDGGPATNASIFFPWGIAVDSFENLYIADDNNVIRRVSSGGIISTIAGGGLSLADGVPATNAALYNPVSVEVDMYGNVYIADGGHAKIRKVSTVGIITTYAGNGSTGFSGDGGPATAAMIRGPRGLRFDAAGNLFFADYGNMRARKVSSSGIITTIAGNGYFAGPGVGGYSGDGGPATNAALNGPGGIGIDGRGNIYISDMMNGALRRVDTSGTIVTALSSHTYFGPAGLAVDTNDDVYIANIPEYTVRKLFVHCTPSAITCFDSICAGSSIVASNTVLDGVWSVSNSHATISTGGRVTAISPGVDTIYYTTSNACGSNIVSKVITVINPMLAGPITGPDSVCAGSTVTLAGGGPGGIWSASNPLATVATTGIVTGVTPGQDTITYRLTNVCGLSFAQKILRIMPLPDAGVISGPDRACIGAHITLTESVSTGAWVASNAHATVAGGFVTGVSGGVDTIMYLVTNYCGTDTASHPVTVTSPSAGTISGPSALCVYDSITLAATLPGGTWMRVNTTADVSPTGEVYGISPGVDTIFYILTDTCGRGTASKTITVNPIPHAGPISGPSSGCTGGVLPLSAMYPGGIWHSSSTLGAPISSSGVVSLILPGPYTIKYSMTNMCGTDTTNRFIVVDQPVSAIAGDTTICAGDTTTLTNAAPGGTWSSYNTYVATVSGGVVTGHHVGVTNISYFVTNSCGTTMATKNVNVVTGGSCIASADLHKTLPNNLALFPNPSDGIFSFSLFTSVNEAITINVTDLAGRTVKEIDATTNKLIDISLHAPPGVYLVTATTTNGKYVSKLIIQ